MDNPRLKQSERYTVIAATISISPRDFDEIIDFVGGAAIATVTVNTGNFYQGVIKIFRNSSTFTLKVQAGSGVTINGLTGTPSIININPGESLTIRSTSTASVWKSFEFSTLNTIQTEVKTASGTGAATTINIPHGLAYTPVVTAVIANNAASNVQPLVTADATNFIFTYAVAPASGTNNLSYNISYKR